MVIISAIFFLYEIITGGGIIIENSSELEGHTKFNITDIEKFDLFLEPGQREIWVPFLFSYYSYKKPYGLKIHIRDKTKEINSIAIEKITIKRIGKKDLIIDCNWKRDLRLEVSYTHQRKMGVIGTEMMTLSDTIENVIELHEACTITLEGVIFKSNGKTIDFKLSNKLSPSFNLMIFTRYQHWAEC